MRFGNNFTTEMVVKWNEEQLELRENLPSLYDALTMAADGDESAMDLFFFYRRRIGSYLYDGKRQRYVETHLEFMDKQMNHFLHYLKEKYSNNSGIGRCGRCGWQQIQDTQPIGEVRSRRD